MLSLAAKLVYSPGRLEQASCSTPRQTPQLLRAAKSQAQEENQQVGAGLELSHDSGETEGRWLAACFVSKQLSEAEGKITPCPSC